MAEGTVPAVVQCANGCGVPIVVPVAFKGKVDRVLCAGCAGRTGDAPAPTESPAERLEAVEGSKRPLDDPFALGEEL